MTAKNMTQLATIVEGTFYPFTGEEGPRRTVVLCFEEESRKLYTADPQTLEVFEHKLGFQQASWEGFKSRDQAIEHIEWNYRYAQCDLKWLVTPPAKPEQPSEWIVKRCGESWSFDTAKGAHKWADHLFGCYGPGQYGSGTEISVHRGPEDREGRTFY